MMVKQVTEPANIAPLLYSVPAACARLGGVGRSWLYEQMKAGRVRVRKLGRRTMLLAEDVDRLAFGEEDAA